MDGFDHVAHLVDHCVQQPDRFAAHAQRMIDPGREHDARVDGDADVDAFEVEPQQNLAWLQSGLREALDPVSSDLSASDDHAVARVDWPHDRWMHHVMSILRREL